MKLSSFACLLLCCSISFAQLSVQNDAYIFVKDQVLFVTDDVNIDDVDSKIYLRDEAQLLQGTGTTGNSGLGQLSVYQTGTVNQWAYNYWCSPVGNNSAAFGNEAARVNLIDEATGIPSAGDPFGLTASVDAQFTAAHNGSASPLTISSRWLWTYISSSAYADWIYAGEAGPINPGLGFTMKGNGTGATGSQLYDFRGKPNNGTISNPVADGDFTLVGNPYPSAMDSVEFIHDPQNQLAINGTLFYWEQDASLPSTQSHVLQDYVGGYSSFTIDSSGVITSNVPAVFTRYDELDNVQPLLGGQPNNGTKQAQRYIPIGQGFMVEGRSGTSGIVRAKNSHRVFAKESDGDSYFFRTANDNYDEVDTIDSGTIQYQENGLSIVPSDYKRFRINVEFTVNEANYVRQLLLNFHDSATAGFDYGLELLASENLESDAYFTLDNEDYLGQAYPFEETLVIPLTVDIAQQQPIRFRIFDIQNFDETQGIYIHDIENDIYIDLRQQIYDINIEPGNYTNRFEIVFTTQALGITDFDANSLNIHQNNNLHQLSVYNPDSIDIQSIEIFDVAGKRLIQKNYDSVEDQYNLSTLRLSDAVYVVNVVSHDSNKAISQKIIVKN